jgi:hypothetical protein
MLSRRAVMEHRGPTSFSDVRLNGKGTGYIITLYINLDMSLGPTTVLIEP